MKPSIDSALCLASPIGPISVFASGERIVRIELGKRTRNIGSAKVLEKFQRELKEYFAGKRKSFSCAKALLGSEFQLAVWSEIAKLKSGQSISYSQLAKNISRPKAVRAVGGAVGANPLPLLIGCHRVLGTNLALTGYSGGSGLKTKIWLLDHEGIEYRT